LPGQTHLIERQAENGNMMKLQKLLILCTFLFTSSSALAQVTLYDQNQWKVTMGGFIELDTIYDTTRSLTEVAGSSALAKKGTFDGDNGRTQFSIRNTRLSFGVTAPVVDDWKTRGYLETDFLGYDPTVASSGTTNSEGSYYTSPTLRIRHAYLTGEKNGWQILAGQTWSLFGWQPNYVLATVSVAPVTGTLYQRSERIGVMKTVSGDTQSLQVAASFQRPTQRDGRIPNFDLGVKWSDDSRKGGFSSANSDIKTQPLSLGLSGTYRNYTYPTTTTSIDDSTSMAALALAANALIPIIASSDGKDVSHTLTAVGEFTVGQGYGDEFPSWSGGLAQLSTAAAAPLNIDSGVGGYNSNGTFELVKLRTWNTQLQYHFEGQTFMTAGYGQLWSSNMGDFAAGSGQTASKQYDRSEAKFVNLAHDFTPQMRVAFEFDQFTTHYSADNSVNHDNRYMIATYFRF